MNTAFLATLALLLGASPAKVDSPDRGMIELMLGSDKVEGMPLAWSRQEVSLLGRDGRLWQFAPEEATRFRKTASRFRAYSTSELRAMLLRELGDRFEVTGSGHYLVAHPHGQRDVWAGRFEDLYRSFVHYFSVRGFQIGEPPCPLIGIVSPSRDAFVRYAAGHGGPAGALGEEVLGYYDLDSNRVLLYDAGGDRDDWQQNAAVAIHEATHQTAFNTGIHSRFAPPPCWVAEGLATMFEAPGVYNSRTYMRQADRINAGWLQQFRQAAAAGPQRAPSGTAAQPWSAWSVRQPELLEDLIASDRMFQVRPREAYAEAWALTFYLVETQREKYAEYLARTANRPAFAPYTPAERTADFTAVFGGDWQMLEARLLRFVDGLP